MKLLCIFAFFPPLRKAEELLELQVLRGRGFFTLLMLFGTTQPCDVVNPGSNPSSLNGANLPKCLV